MGEAARIMRERRGIDVRHVGQLDRRLRKYLRQIDRASVNGSPRARVPGIVNVQFEGVAAEALMVVLEDVAISSGSACTSAEVKPSHVLLGLGLAEEEALSSVRFSFGRFTTTEEIDRVGRFLVEVVPDLRRL